MKRLIFIVLFLLSPKISADVEGSTVFVGSSAFMLSNLDTNTKEPVNFYQLNLGYQLTKKDVVSLELITWRYYAPLGEAYSGTSKYLGHVDAAGAGLAYQRFLWGNFYSALHATLLKQKYVDNAGVRLGEGEQLFMAFRFGYHLEFASGAIFIEPSVALTHWPVNTGLPDSFQEQENRSGKFQVEPGLHFGFLF